MTREAEQDAVARFWARRHGDRELWWLIASLLVWLAAMVALILEWIPTGGF